MGRTFNSDKRFSMRHEQKVSLLRFDDNDSVDVVKQDRLYRSKKSNATVSMKV